MESRGVTHRLPVHPLLVYQRQKKRTDWVDSALCPYHACREVPLPPLQSGLRLRLLFCLSLLGIRSLIDHPL